MTSTIQNILDEAGQYMVEFALTLTIFIFFMIFVIDIGLMIYNHNLFYNGVYEAAREASLGVTNSEIRNTFHRVAVENYFPTLTMRAHLEGGLNITPEEEINRVQGKEITVSNDAIFGINIFGILPITLNQNISSSHLMTKLNDKDRDGCKDELEGNNSLSTNPACGHGNFTSTQTEDHDNDGLQDNYVFDAGADTDADDDGTNNTSDTVVVGFFQNVAGPCPGFPTVSCLGSTYTGYAIHRPNDPKSSPSSCGRFSWDSKIWHADPCFTGRYHAPEIWNNGRRDIDQLFSKRLPKFHVLNGTDVAFTRKLKTERDSDNDAWIDKFDDKPNDSTQH